MSDDTKPLYVEPKVTVAADSTDTSVVLPNGVTLRLKHVEPGAPLPALPPLPTKEQLNYVPPEAIAFAYQGLQQIIVLYAKAGRMDDVKAAADQIRTLDEFITEKQANCDCESCVARREAEAEATGAAADAISKAAGSANVAKPLGRAPDGGYLN